ncbi:MAG: hypothetical protein JSV44_01825 [Candidatus Zixiibacteriota bacterium]|nr:MAG: hypothetical protein JSV44_01825 [candidate division Zixibacteria bacterium]
MMDPKKRQTIIGILFVGAVIYGLLEFTRETKPPSSPAPQPLAAMPAAERGTPSHRTIDIEEYSGLQWGRDPFYRGINNSPARPKPETVKWTLNGILYDENTPSAMINHQIVKPGDIIDGAEVIEIGKQGVILYKNGSRFWLHITKDKS